MSSNACDKCSCMDVFLRKKGAAIGLYCDGCGRWYKWIGKKDVVAYTKRGFKVLPEDYEPPHLAPSAPVVHSSGSMIGEPYSQEVTSNPEDIFVPPIESIIRKGEPEVITQRDTSNFDPCTVCITGVIDPISKSDDVSLAIFDKTLFLRTRDSTRMFGAFKITHCPCCGRKL
jgi:hypothetical protein